MSAVGLGGLTLALEGDHRAQVLYVVALVVLTAGTLLCVAALRVARLDVVAVAVTCAGAAGWLLSNKPGEGSTLVVVAPGNGVTAADLLVLPAAVIVTVLCCRRLRRPVDAGALPSGSRAGVD